MSLWKSKEEKYNFFWIKNIKEKNEKEILS